jgi:hypothetical protein
MGPLLRTYDHLRGNGLIGLVLVRHLNETETPGLARELVLDVVAARDFTENGEGFLDLSRSNRETEGLFHPRKDFSAPRIS